MYWTVWTLLLSISAGIYGYITTVPLKLHSTRRFPCSYHVRAADRILAVQWFKSSRSDVFVYDGEAVAWWDEEEAGGSQGFDIKDDFSLIIHNVNLSDAGVYRCIVTPSGIEAYSTHDIKLLVYATPSNSILIEYTRQSKGFSVNCSLHHIYPRNYSTFTSCCGSESEIDPIINGDGTYNVTFTNFLPYSEEDLTIECLYSNFNYESSSSLRLASFHIDCPGESDMEANNVSRTDVHQQNTRSLLWMGWVILFLEVFVLIVIIHGVITGRMIFRSAAANVAIALQHHGNETDQDVNLPDNDGEHKQHQSRSIIFLAKPYYPALIITVKLMVIIVVVVYLAIAH